MEELLKSLDEIKRSLESLAGAIENYADAMDSNAPSPGEKLDMALTVEDVDSWLVQNPGGFRV
jgi:hypothetical protein